MTITFVDAGVLIAAVRGRTEVSAQAMAILDNPERTFASSEFVRREVLLKALVIENHGKQIFTVPISGGCVNLIYPRFLA